jgi:hypothetical protein
MEAMTGKMRIDRHGAAGPWIQRAMGGAHAIAAAAGQRAPGSWIMAGSAFRPAGGPSGPGGGNSGEDGL